MSQRKSGKGSVERKGRARASRRSAIGLTILILTTGGIGSAHEEREAFFPDGDGQVPAFRLAPASPRLVVCKPDSAGRIAALPAETKALNEALLDECSFTHVQQAIDAVTQRGTTIYLLPGVYREEPSREPPGPECADVASHDFGSLSYADQARCPHVENLIAILGDADAREGPDYSCNDALCDLQIEGSGATPEDVIIDGGFDAEGNWVKHNGIRADRADGVYLRNFTVQRFGFNAVYILETDGFVIDRVVAHTNEAYGFLTFMTDHGLYVDCEAFRNGDGGLYPGSVADVAPARFAIEITRCSSHHNFVGFSGTSGNAVYAHDNDFYMNATGVEMDSVFPHHPGAPQDGSLFERNRIFSNNYNPYERWVQTGKCDQPPGKLREQEPEAICPIYLVPVGTGVMVAGGNANLFRHNDVWDNWRYGFVQFYVPAFVREELDPSKQVDTSHFNRYASNRMGFGPAGATLPNGLDFWWDEQGQGNCWEGNVSSGGAVTSDPAALPRCRDHSPLFLPFNPVKSLPLVPCISYDRSDPVLRDPPGCTWQRTPSAPGAQEQSAPADGGTRPRGRDHAGLDS